MENQKFEVSVKALLFDSTGRILIVKEKPEHQNWMVPGGRLQPNETIQDGLARELMEETSLPVPHDLKLIDVYVITNRLGQPTADVIFSGSLPDGLLTLSDEHVTSKWISRDDLPATEFWHPELKAAVAKAFDQR